jgi:hypothetical protein
MKKTLDLLIWEGPLVETIASAANQMMKEKDNDEGRVVFDGGIHQQKVF